MEMNELLICSSSANANANANANADDMLLFPSSSPPPPPSLLFHIDSSFRDTLLHLDSVLASPSSTATLYNDNSFIDQLFCGNVLIPSTSHFNHHHHQRPTLSTQPRVAKFSSHDKGNPPLGKYVSAAPSIPRLGNCDSPNCWDDSSRSREGSSISEQIPGKSKCLDRGKAKEPSKFAEGGDDSVITTTKRTREDEEVDGGDDIGPGKQPKLGNEAGEGGRKKKKNKGGGGDDVEPPKDYIHVRARRGQATDSHSLAERV